MNISVVIGDITKLRFDAIVNAANASLRGGGGVDGAIHRAAGFELLGELVERYPDGMVVGDAVVTFGYQLPAMFVIHTVGPRYYLSGVDHAAMLASCYRRCLEEAERLGLTSIAFPAISTGAYGYPMNEAAKIAVQTVTSFNAEHIQSVAFVFLDEAAAGPTRLELGAI